MAETTAQRIRREQRERIAKLNAAKADDAETAFEKDARVLRENAAKLAREAAQAAADAEVRVDVDGGEGALRRLKNKSARAIRKAGE